MAYFHVVTAATGALSLSYALIYLVNSGTQPLPWSTCGWPPELENASSSCYVIEADGPRTCKQVHRSLGLRFEARDEREGVPVVLGDRVVLVPREQIDQNCTPRTINAVRRYHREVLLKQRNTAVGTFGVDTDIALAYAITWAIACVLSSSHVALSRVGAYSLVIVRVFLVWFLSAKVLAEGLKKEIWKKLLRVDPAQIFDFENWKVITERSLFSVGCSRSFLRLASWNKFFSKFRCVAPVIALADFATTLMSTVMVFLLLGLLSEKTDVELEEYFAPKDADFVSVAQAILMLEQKRLFSALYFGVMFLMGICDLIIVQEVVLEIIEVEFPRSIGRGVLSRAMLCLVIYVFSLPLLTEVGPYIADLLDHHFKGTPYLLINLLEVLVFCHVYGIRRLSFDADVMENRMPNWFLKILWTAVLPITFLALVISRFVRPTPNLSYDGYDYPAWANYLVLGLVLLGIGFIPAYALAIFKANGGWRSTECLLPSMRWGPNRDIPLNYEYQEKVLHKCEAPVGTAVASRRFSVDVLRPPVPSPLRLHTPLGEVDSLVPFISDAHRDTAAARSTATSDSAARSQLKAPEPPETSEASIVAKRTQSQTQLAPPPMKSAKAGAPHPSF
ncbi:sodium-dependent proline transporter-like [Haemaphysalis longicornis]